MVEAFLKSIKCRFNYLSMIRDSVPPEKFASQAAAAMETITANLARLQNKFLVEDIAPLIEVIKSGPLKEEHIAKLIDLISSNVCIGEVDADSNGDAKKTTHGHTLVFKGKRLAILQRSECAFANEVHSHGGFP